MNRPRPWLEYAVVLGLIVVAAGAMLVSAAAPKMFHSIYAKRGW